MKNNLYKDYIKKKKLQEIYKEEIVVKEDSKFSKLLSFLLEFLVQILKILYYIAIIVLCSIGATCFANKLGIMNFWR